VMDLVRAELDMPPEFWRTTTNNAALSESQ
jgi:hypothetical protein